MLNAEIRVRAIPDEVFNTIMEMLREEAKDVRVETWASNEPPGYKPRGAYSERPPTRGGRRTGLHTS